jgi:RimJ/RimL family protein N-acetyltransferase
VIIRPTTDADRDRILACPVNEPAGLIPPDRYRDELARHQYRPEWTWIAEDAGCILARATWWGFGDGAYPIALDCVYAGGPLAGSTATGRTATGRVALAAELIAAGQRALRPPDRAVPPRYEIALPMGWRSDPAVMAAFGWRRDAAARAGLSDELERIRFEWSPDAGLPRPSGRLVFRPEPDDDVFLDVFRQIAVGSLDVMTRREVALLGPDRQAREDMDIYLAMPGDRDWWRLAYRAADGQLAGMILPNRNSDGAVVGYLGVVPGLRGRGYINDLVAQTTRFHAGRGEARIAATTDSVNRPMAAAFGHAGYRACGIRYVLSEPSG